MSTIRVKRKHVLDSDSEDSDDVLGLGSDETNEIETKKISTSVAEAALVDVTDDDGDTPNQMNNGGPKKRLMSAADREAARLADQARSANVVTVIDLAGPSHDGTGPDRSAPIDLADSGDSDSELDLQVEEDAALVRCAQISKRLRKALGQDVGRSDGPLSPNAGGGQKGGSSKETKKTKKRQLVTANDVKALAGETSACGSLKPYQMIGINFLLLLDEQDVPGAILADEMGLGKTAQTIAYLTMSRHRKANGEGGWKIQNEKMNKFAAAVASQKNAAASQTEPALVVAPASLLENWRRELQFWAPNLRIGFYHGAAGQKDVREKADVYSKKFGNGKVATGGGAFDVLIACYSLFERDSADQKSHRAWLRQMTYSHLVLDEAHLVKNRNTQRAKRLDTVASKAKRRVLLTGTPLQNNLLELEALIHLVLPGLLKEGALVGDGDGDGDAGDDGSLQSTRAQRVKTILKPFILRRLKEEVAKELEVKQQVVAVEAMTDTQSQLYTKTVQKAREERRRKKKDAEGLEDAGKGTMDASGSIDLTAEGATADPIHSKSDPQKSGTKTKQLFVHLRKIANHPLLVRDKFSDKDVEEMAVVCHKSGVFGYEANLDRVRSHLFDEGYSDFDLHKLCSDPITRGQLTHKKLNDECVLDSGKTRKLLSLLTELKQKGSRPLIFSQWKIVLDILEVALRLSGHNYVRLDGATPTEERQKICDDYNSVASSAFAFLLSTRAGGQGLNLTSADTVIIHDCDFNPQIDRQAEDRCHRLGQTKPVTVIRLVTGETVDKRIVDIATKKLDLDAAILSDPKAVAAEENRAMHEIMEDLLG